MTDSSGTSRGATVLMTCIADGYPETSIKWYYNLQLITEGPKYRLIRNEPGYSQLEVTPRDLTDFGVYSCQADNSVGKSQRDIPLLVAQVPQYEPVIERGLIRPDSITINIRSPQQGLGDVDGGMPVESYKIQYRLSGVDWSRPNEEEPQVNPLASNKDIFNFEIKNLMPDTEYVFRVAAVNKPGVGKWSPDTGIRTPQRRQPDPVRLLSSEDCGYSTKCSVEWTPEGNGGSNIKEYFIRWRRVRLYFMANLFDHVYNDLNFKGLLQRRN
jgi:titin